MSDAALERRNGFVLVELPVCWMLTEGCSLGNSADPGGVIGAAGAKVERKWLLSPVTSLGSGSIRGSMIARCACENQHVYSPAHQTGRTASIVMVLSECV